jgi:anti-sigma B factor antagonist
MPAFDLFEIREADTVSIVRFAQEIVNFSHRASDLHEQLLRFVGDHSCLKLVIDLRDTTYLPSSVLGVLVQLHNHGCEVHLANASDDVVEVLQVTQLVRMIHVNETIVEPWSDENSELPEVVVAGVQGYCVTCPECLHEVDTDKHNLGKREVCGRCDHEFAVTADLLREATHLSADCPSCRGLQTIQCPLCDTPTEIRMIV